MKPLRKRDWFQNAYIRCAALLMAQGMLGKCPENAVSVIEGELERAYKMGVRDAKNGRA